MLAVAAQQLRVLLVDRQPRNAGRANLDHPAIVDLADKNVRNHVFSGGRADREAGLRVAAFDQRQGVVQLGVGGPEVAP